jgi:hypothetical protein
VSAKPHESQYRKIATNAPNALRMAIAIGVHHTYTISDLFDTLWPYVR